MTGQHVAAVALDNGGTHTILRKICILKDIKDIKTLKNMEEHVAGVYMSSNYGESWSLSSAPLDDYVAVNMDSVSRYIIALIKFGDYVYITSDYGESWTKQMVTTTKVEWKSVTVDQSGNKYHLNI